MSKSIKLVGNTYLDSTGIVHEHALLSQILNNRIVYDSGSNNNGNYIRFTDGTMICDMNFQINNVAVTGRDGILYYAVLDHQSFPIEFISVPRCFVDIDYANPAYSLWLRNSGDGATTTQTPKKIITSGNSVTCSIVFSVIAIGKWK